MFRNSQWLIAATAGVLFAAMAVQGAAGATKSKDVGMGQVEISAAAHSGTFPNELAAFVPTLSNGLCQVTLAESSFPISGTTIFCSVREVDGIEGLFVHIFLPEVPPTDAIWIVTLYQEGARGYGSPIACDGGC